MLCIHSPVFTAMFSGNYAESKKEVEIKDISPPIFYKTLLYLYKGILNTRSISETLSVLRVADKYQMDNLKTECITKIKCFKITWDIFWDLIFDYFTNSLDHLCPIELKLNILIFLDENATEVLTDENFCFQNRETLKMFISRDTLHISELALSNAVVSWARMQCCKQNVNPSAENQRKVLDDIIYMIRLKNIGTIDIMRSKIYELLTEEEKESTVDKDSMIVPSHWKLGRARGKLCRELVHDYLETEQYNFESPIYFIFAKDGFIHEIKIKIPSGRIITSVVLSTLNDRGVTISKETFFSNTLTLIYVKAFVCYKLEFVSHLPDEHQNLRQSKKLPFGFGSCNPKLRCSVSSSWSFENNFSEIVLFSIQETFVKNIKLFFSSDYWKKVFSSQPPELGDDEVISITNDLYTLIDNVKITFLN